MARDPYEVLGISPDASLEEAHSAYRRQAAICHPDRFDGQPKAQAEANVRMAALNDAWDQVQRTANASGATGQRAAPPKRESKPEPRTTASPDPKAAGTKLPSQQPPVTPSSKVAEQASTPVSWWRLASIAVGLLWVALICIPSLQYDVGKWIWKPWVVPENPRIPQLDVTEMDTIFRGSLRFAGALTLLISAILALGVIVYRMDQRPRKGAGLAVGLLWLAACATLVVVPRVLASAAEDDALIDLLSSGSGSVHSCGVKSLLVSEDQGETWMPDFDPTGAEHTVATTPSNRTGRQILEHCAVGDGSTAAFQVSQSGFDLKWTHGGQGRLVDETLLVVADGPTTPLPTGHIFGLDPVTGDVLWQQNGVCASSATDRFEIYSSSAPGSGRHFNNPVTSASTYRSDLDAAAVDLLGRHALFVGTFTGSECDQPEFYDARDGTLLS